MIVRKIEYYINVLHYVIYNICKKYQKVLPGFPSDINSGRIILLLSLIPGVQFFVFYLAFCKIRHREFQAEFIFLFLIPFGLLIWFSVIHKDKYLTYFKEFEKEPTEVKRKWAWISFGVVVGIILLLIASFWIMTEAIN
jgi:archaellum biogenesis protein FlaJ (TadC family)